VNLRRQVELVERGAAKAEDEIEELTDALANRDRELEDSRIRSVQATQKLKAIRAALGTEDPSPEVTTEQLVREMSRELAELKEKNLAAQIAQDIVDNAEKPEPESPLYSPTSPAYSPTPDEAAPSSPLTGGRAPEPSEYLQLQKLYKSLKSQRLEDITKIDTLQTECHELKIKCADSENALAVVRNRGRHTIINKAKELLIESGRGIGEMHLMVGLERHIVTEAMYHSAVKHKEEALEELDKKSSECIATTAELAAATNALNRANAANDHYASVLGQLHSFLQKDDAYCTLGSDEDIAENPGLERAMRLVLPKELVAAAYASEPVMPPEYVPQAMSPIQPQ
jgi:hypothetical protein